MILTKNTRLQNRYLIVRLLGQGGFGAVYEARDERLGHRVALKQLTLTGPQVMKAFEHEARILARLDHPTLPKVTDFFADFNSYFLVMQYIEGDDFNALLAWQRGPFPVEQVLEWADQLLDGLDYLHRQQPPVIHRDIKPANIKLSPQGQIYLLDFGISKGGQAYTYQAMSGTSIYAFSLHYASMEQIEGKGTDARSDLYSLAVMLHHLLTKQAPPQTVSRLSANAMNRADPLPPVNQLNPQVPVGVAQVLAQALNFDPDLRPQSAAEMRQMLKEAMPAPQPPPTRLIYQPAPQPSTPFSWPLAVGVGIILLLLGLVGGWVLFAPASEREATADNTPVATATLAEEVPATEIAVVTEPTDTPLPTQTPLPTYTALPTYTVPPTEALPTNTPPPPATPTLGPGATAIAPIDGMVLHYVPEGDFEMGSNDGPSNEQPQHTVYLNAFWIDQTEVTNAMFAKFLAKTEHQTDAEKEGWAWVLDGDSWNQVNGADWQHPQDPESNLDGLDDYPVIQVSWNDATAYCQWAERRLPTEAEWEKAAGGILTEEEARTYPWGNDVPSGDLVNFCDENCTRDWKDSSINDGYERTSPVGNYPAGASPYGALDMAGNVWEWVSDSYDSNYYASSPRENPTGPSINGTKVFRGGSWVYAAPKVRVRNRGRGGANDRVESVGFRCARSLNEA